MREDMSRWLASAWRALVKRVGVSRGMSSTQEASLGEALEALKADLAALAILGSGLQTLGFVALSWALGFPAPTWIVGLVWACGELGCYGAMRRGLAARWAVHGYALVCMGCMFALAGLTGGDRSPLLLWLPGVMAFVAIMLGARAGLVWACVSSAGVLVMWAARAQGWVSWPPSLLSPSLQQWAWATTLIGLTGILWLFVWTHAALHGWVVRRLALREAQLVRAHQLALASSRAKGQFMATMSHELRTPLNAIIGYAELIQESAQDDEALDREALEPDLARILTSAKHLRGLIDDVLELARAEAGASALSLEELELTSLVRAVADSLGALAKAKGNTLTLEASSQPLMVRSDARRLRQIVLNLLGNAYKFTRQGHVRLALERQAREGVQGVRLIIEDTGPGISPQDLTRIFEPFVQVDGSSTRAQGGTGLGLAITRQSCELLGGSITARSTVGQGSAFIVWLPLSAPEA